MLTSFAKNTHIKAKLGILFVLPVAALTILSISQTLRMWERKQSIQAMDRVIGAEIDVYQLALELQKERSLSVGILAKNDHKLKEAIHQQRLATDAILNKQHSFLSNVSPIKSTYKFDGNNQNINVTLDQLPRVRQDIDAYNKDGDFWGYYSKLIKNIIRLVELPAAALSDAGYVKRLQSYTLVSWLIERLAQERGMLIRVLSKQNLSRYDLQTLHGLTALQRNLVSDFNDLGISSEVKSLEAVWQNPDSQKIERLRSDVVAFSEKRELLDQLHMAIGHDGLMQNYKSYLLGGSPNDLMGVTEKVNKIKGIISKYLQIQSLQPQDNQSFQGVLKAVQAYEKKLSVVVEMKKNHRPIQSVDKAVYAEGQRIMTALEQLRSNTKIPDLSAKLNIMAVQVDKINEIRKAIKADTVIYAKGVKKRADIVFFGFILGMILIIGTMVWFGMIISNRLLSSLDVMSNTLDAVVEDGNFSLRVSLDGKDEVGRMAQMINHHLSRLETVLRQVNTHFSQAIDEGEVTFMSHEELSGDLKKLVAGVEYTSEKISNALDAEKKSHQVLVKAKKGAEQASQAKSDFLSSMSHELRTPLNAILGFAQVLKFPSQNPLDDKQKLAVNHIIKGGEHLLLLINEVLELAKIESGSYAITLMGMDVRDVIEDSLIITASLAEKRAIKLENTTDYSNLPLIMADPARLKQICINLLSNAVKYNRSGGHVGFEAKKISNGWVRFVVSDNGPGIPLDQQKDLFVPFNRLGNEGKGIEGTGIGLTITQKLTEGMGGKIGFESNLGKGSEFWVDFPIAEFDLEDSANAGVETDSFPNDVEVTRSKKVLYVEDNPTNLLLMEHIIDSIMNVDILVAHTAEIGLIIAVREKPDLILMDINLPGINGDEAMWELQNNPLTEHVPVIAISADAMQSDIDNYMKSGFKGYLTKPFQVDEVLGLIFKHIDDGGQKT